MIVVITGIGWVTVAGMGRGREHGSFAMIDGQLPKFDRKAAFEKPYQHFGRMDEYSKLGLAAIAFALKDAGLDEWEEKRDIGIIASTVYGCLSTDIKYYDTVIPEEGLLASPSLFAYTLPNCFLGEAAIRFGLTGASFVVNEQALSGLTSLRMAVDSIAWGESETMLAGVCDLGCPPNFVVPGRAVPGAVFFVIERIYKRKCSHYGELLLDKKGAIFFKGCEIEDLKELVRKRLSI